MTFSLDVDATLHERVNNLTAALTAWLEANRAYEFSADPATNAFCHSYLEGLCNTQILLNKLGKELGHSLWEPLGRVLIIVSEKDILGTSLAFFGAFLTGNAMTIKARGTGDFLCSLRDVLGLDDKFCSIIDWEGGAQDDQALLENVQGVLLAGSEDLIRHFRAVVPYSVRLIIFGPKLSAVVIGTVSSQDVSGLAKQLVKETSLFLQEVCSSPRFILIQDYLVAEELYKQLANTLSTLPVLSHEERLLQMYKHQDRTLYLKAVGDQRAFSFLDKDTGWAVGLDTCFKPEIWLPKGFNIVYGPLDRNLEKARKLWPGALQTLGLAGDMSCLWSGATSGFTRVCPLGKMHDRPLTAPHDGFFELSALVSFLSVEI